MSDVAGIGGVAQAAGSVASAAIQANAISSAADKQAASAKYAQDLLQSRYDTTRGDFQDYRNFGGAGTNILLNSLPELATTQSRYTDILDHSIPQTPAAMTQAQLEATPGYQFTLGQGLKATQNSAAARGLGVSGAALKGAATYATGLSDQTYNTRFNQAQQIFGNQQSQFGDIQNLFSNEQTLKSNAWNRLAGMVNTGLSAAGQTASLGASAASQGAQIAQQAGNAQAAAGIAQGNAFSGAVNGIGNAFQQNSAYNRLFGNGSDGGIYGGFDSAGMGGTAAGSSVSSNQSGGGSVFDQSF